MIDGLVNFIDLIKEFVLSIVDGLKTLIDALHFVFEVSHNFVWMPNFVATVIGLSVTIIIVLRIVGR